MTDSQHYAEQIRDAFEHKRPLIIRGSGSKGFFGDQANAVKATAEFETLSTVSHSGVISYEPTELVVRAHAGTSIHSLRQTLDEQGQELPFDPPSYAENDTLGGVIACALAGPSRPFRGGVRDFVLGTQIINGQGQVLRFGGEVMKNVAGYDVSRLQVGALGSLGLLLDISLKVLPQSEARVTTVREISSSEVTAFVQKMQRQPVPVDAIAIEPHGAGGDNVQLIVRFAGSQAAVARALADHGGDRLDKADHFWTGLRDMKHKLLQRHDEQGQQNLRLWRLTMSASSRLDQFLQQLPGLDGQNWLMDWGGAQRWCLSSASSDDMHAFAAENQARASVFGMQQHPSELSANSLPEAGNLSLMHKLQLRIKSAFDPANILNPGLMPLTGNDGPATTGNLPPVNAVTHSVMV